LLQDIVSPEKGLVFGQSVDPIPNFDCTINDALSHCDAYLKEHAQAGVVHGDFHSLNFRVNDAGEITGLFDLTFAGRNGNYLVDFAMLPDEALPFVLEEYQREMGIDIDPKMVILTQISQDAADINWRSQNPDGCSEIIAARTHSLVKRLNAVQDITGVELALSSSLKSGGPELGF